MPYCEVDKHRNDKYSEGIKIYYERYGGGDIKVLLIIGLAGTHDSWGPQIRGLTGIDMAKKGDEIDEKRAEYANGCFASGSPEMRDLMAENGGKESLKNSVEVCSFDNRGVGRSSVPKHKSYYTTTVMARDALALLDHLGWNKAHVVGHSMGAMIACKLAAMEPNRISSLALLNATGGGFECFPKVDRTMISIVIRFLKARTPEERADVDLDTHYTKEFLEAYIGSVKRRKILYEDYVRNISASGMQSNHGFDGHVNACWTHKVTPKEYETIRTAGILVAVIHGRHDIIAQVRHGRRIAKKLYPVARMIELHGGHLVSHERPEEVNQVLMELIEASESNVHSLEWVKLSQVEISNGTGGKIQDEPSQYQEEKEHEDRSSTCFYRIWTQLQVYLCYFFGLFVIMWEYVRQLFVCFRKEKVEPFHTPVDPIDQDFTRTKRPSALAPQY